MKQTAQLTWVNVSPRITSVTTLKPLRVPTRWATFFIAGLLLAATALTSLAQSFLFDFGADLVPTGNGPAPNDPVNHWNNVTLAIGGSSTGQLPNLITTQNTPTGVGLSMISQFSPAGANQAGTQVSTLFPANATSDSLFGHTELWPVSSNGDDLENVFPSFKLTGLDPALTYNFTFYASRAAADNRETDYTVTGGNSGSAALNVANNIDNFASVSGITPNGADEIAISLAPGPNNDNAFHFTYLGTMRLDPVALLQFLPPVVSNGQVTLNWTGSGQLDWAPTVLGPWTPLTPVPCAPYSEAIGPDQQRFFRLSAVQTTFTISPSKGDPINNARLAVRKVNGSMTGDIVVCLRGGEYVLSSPLVFDAADSGTNGFNVIYRASPGERPVITGGQRITGWVLADADKGIYKAPVGSLRFRQLYVNGVRAVRARQPNVGTYDTLLAWDTGGRRVQIAGNGIGNWQRFNQVEMVVLGKGVNQSNLRVASFSPSGGNTFVTPMEPERTRLFQQVYPPKEKRPYYFENAREFLDQPGEWYLNTQTSEVFYMPRPGDDLSTAVVPRLETLLKIQGTLASPVHHIQFHGITFEHSTWLVPDSEGYVGDQASLVFIELLPEDQISSYPGHRLPGAVHLEAADDIRFERNIFRRLGASAINLYMGNHNNALIGNVIADVSGSGISVDVNLEGNPPDARKICRNNRIQNNYIAGTGRDYFQSVGIMAGYTDGSLIEHNELSDMPYSGISVGWGWKNVPNAAQNNMIRYNDVRGVLNKMSDGAGIYTLSRQPGTLIAENYVHDIVRTSVQGSFNMSGIYLDEGCNNISVQDNVLLRTADRKLFQNANGPDNTFTNNDGSSSCVIANAGLEAAYRDIRTGGAAFGPLRKHPANGRYFTDGSLRAVYLTGSHTWANLVDNGLGVGAPLSIQDPPPAFDYTAYLNLLQTNHHNFIRLWRWELPKTFHSTGSVYFAQPHPWTRSGPGTANDGKPKFNLNQLDQSYFDRLRARVIAARDRGIYVSIMLFEGWIFWDTVVINSQTWKYHPFNVNNNVNGINGDANGNGQGEETHTLQIAAVVNAQKAYVRKVIDTVNDLDNVLYEVANETGVAGSTEWQYDLINYIKSYESGKAKRHPVGMTLGFIQGPGASQLWNSPADWISLGGSPYVSDPPAAPGGKVIILDTDHTGWGVYINDVAFSRAWVWKSFTRGHNPILMEDLKGNSGWIAARAAMGHTRTYADKMNLVAMTPQNGLSTTAYCLAKVGSEYLAYQPESGSFAVNLVAGTYALEWFNPATGAVVSSGSVNATGGNQTFTPPFSGPAVLYLKVTSP